MRKADFYDEPSRVAWRGTCLDEAVNAAAHHYTVLRGGGVPFYNQERSWLELDEAVARCRVLAHAQVEPLDRSFPGDAQAIADLRSARAALREFYRDRDDKPARWRAA